MSRIATVFPCLGDTLSKERMSSLGARTLLGAPGHTTRSKEATMYGRLMKFKGRDGRV